MMARAVLVALLLAFGARAEPLAFGTNSRTIFVLPVWIALDRGFFRDEGLDVTVVVTDNVDRVREGLVAGTLDVAISAPDAVIADDQAGPVASIVAGNAERLPHFIIAVPRIHTLAELKGARMGVAGASDGTTSLMGDIAHAGGFQTSDLVLKVVGGAPTRWKLLREGAIDAGLQPFPLSYEAEAAGFTNLGPVLDIVPDYEFTAFVVAPAWATVHRDTLVRFLRALQRGNAAMFADHDRATEVAAREMQTSPALARRSIDDAMRMGIFTRDLSVSRPAMQRVFDTLQDSGRLPAGLAMEWTRYVDESYLQESRK